MTHYYLLLLAEAGIYERISPANCQTLERKNYIAAGKLTDTGRALLSSLKVDIPAVEVKQKVKRLKNSYHEQFEDWWLNYPAGRTWKTESGKVWEGTGQCRIKKDLCEVKYMNFLNQGADPGIMKELVNHHVEKLKRETRTENRMTYMPSTERWLNTLSYRDFVEAMENDRMVNRVQPTTRQTRNRDELF